MHITDMLLKMAMCLLHFFGNSLNFIVYPTITLKSEPRVNQI